MELFRQQVFIGTIQVFRTCARAGAAAASVSHPVSHNEDEYSFDVFIHTAFVYMFTDSGRAHDVKRHCCDSVHQTETQPRSNGTERHAKQVILLSVSYEAKQYNGTLPANCPPLETAVWELHLWRPGGFGREGEPCSACVSCQRIC